MSEQERNRALSRRWFEEVWNQGREATIDELAAPNAACRGVGEGGRCLESVLCTFAAPRRHGIGSDARSGGAVTVFMTLQAAATTQMSRFRAARRVGRKGPICVVVR